MKYIQRAPSHKFHQLPTPCTQIQRTYLDLYRNGKHLVLEQKSISIFVFNRSRIQILYGFYSIEQLAVSMIINLDLILFRSSIIYVKWTSSDLSLCKNERHLSLFLGPFLKSSTVLVMQRLLQWMPFLT